MSNDLKIPFNQSETRRRRRKRQTLFPMNNSCKKIHPRTSRNVIVIEYNVIICDEINIDIERNIKYVDKYHKKHNKHVFIT